MSYKEILEKQSGLLRKELRWWPSFFYHFTDVHNAVSILADGWILSREKVQASGKMKNDNASRAVIEATNVENKCYGRLYFRPLTPTQYHSEGYKPEELRDPIFSANCPVPIFFCLSASGTLEYPGTKFAPRGLAGCRHDIQEGEEAFSRLDFNKIYHDGPYNNLTESDIKEYRHSEVIREGGFPVEPLLQCILCRTVAEKETLLYLIKNYSMRMYNSYKDRILYQPKIKCFNSNNIGIFVKRVYVNDDMLTAEFNDSEQRYTRGEENVPIEIHIQVFYMKDNGQILGEAYGKGSFNYVTIRSCQMKMDIPQNCDILRIKISFDESIMYENEIAIGESKLY